MIDSQAIVDPSAEIADDVSIGPWSIVGPRVSIDSGTSVASHVVIKANTRIGKNNQIYQFSSIGEDPADKKFAGEETWLEIGDNNIIREGANYQRGTGVGGAVTRIGSNNLLMPYVHIAHDCIVGSNTVFANNASISGHVEVDDWAILGGYAGVNQFLKIGAHCMIGGMTHVDHDVPAFVIVSGRPAAVRSVNVIGLERRGYSKESIKVIRAAFKTVYRRQLTLAEAIAALQTKQRELEGEACELLSLLVNSLVASEKGIHR